jgi:hypothetical protein
MKLSIFKLSALSTGLVLFTANAYADISQLAWLAGNWCGDNHGVHNEEIWLAPRGASMIGMHRDIDVGRNALVGFEFFRIVEDGAELVYWTQPGGKPATAFRANTVADNTVEFINPQHDFPKRIRYRRIDETTLVARIDDGTSMGPSMEWRWQLNCQ